MRKILMTALFVVLPLCAAEAAQYVVSEARGIGISVGTVIDPTKALILKQGQHLTLISEDGDTIKLDGPYQKAPAAAQGVQLSEAIGGLITERNARTSQLGTTRGTTPKPPLPGPWFIDATSSGSACLPQGEAPVLWRPVDQTQAALVIAPADRSWKADASWPAGQAALKLDPSLGMHGDASYFVDVDGAESAISITTVPSVLATDKMRAAWMIDKGCGRQAAALLHTQ